MTLTMLVGSTARWSASRRPLVQDGRGQNMELNLRPLDIAVERPLGQGDRDPQLEAAVQQLLASPEQH